MREISGFDKALFGGDGTEHGEVHVCAQCGVFPYAELVVGSRARGSSVGTAAV